MKRRLLIALTLLLLLPLLPALWLLTSESGLQWAYRQALPRLPGELRIAELTGRLTGPISARQIEYRQADLEASAAQLELLWDPWALLHGEIEIDALELDGLALALPQAASGNDAPSGDGLPQIELPLRLQLKRLEIDGIEIARGETRLELQRLLLGATVGKPGLEVDRLELSARDYGIELEGSLLPAAQYPHDFNLRWHAQLPTGARFEGEGRLRGNLRETRLDHSLEGALQLDLALVLNDLLKSPRWKVDARVDEFDSQRLDPALPPFTGALEIVANGDLEAAGASGRIQILSGAPLPLDVNFHLDRVSANAENTGLNFRGLRLQTVDGEIDASGELDWTPVLAWSAKVEARNLNPVRLAPQWPGNLGATISSTGRIEDGVPGANFDIAQISGDLRGYPVRLSGSLKLQDRDLAVEGLRFTSGSTRLDANGELGERLDLRWTLQSPNLAEIYPDAAGRLDAEGSLQGTQTAPTISAKFNGSALGFGETRVAGLDGNARLDLLQPQSGALAAERLELRVDAKEIDLPGQRIDSLRIDADNRRISARLESALANARLELDGRLDGSAWRGRVTGLEIGSGDYGDWSLQKPAALELAPDRVSLGDLCLQTALRNGLCASLQKEDDWRIDAGLSKFPLLWLARLIPPELQVSGEADARVSLRFRPPEQLFGEIGVDLAPGIVGYRLGEDRIEQVRYGGGRIETTLDADGIRATGNLKLRQGENLTASLHLPGAAALTLDLQQQVVQASASGNLVDLGIVDALLDDIDELSGRGNFRLALEGPLGQPRPRGEFSLVDVSFRIPRLQLGVTRLSADAISEDGSALKYRVDAETADGRLKLDGRSLLDPASGWASELRVEAGDLALAQLLKSWLPQQLALDGRLNGNADLELRLPDRLHGTVRLVTRDGTLTYPLPDGEPGTWALRETVLSLALNDSGIAGDAGFRIGDNNFIAHFNLPGGSLLRLEPGEQEIQGTVDIDFRDLSLIETLLPDLHRASGQVEVNLALSGNLAQPIVRGRAELQDASVRIPRLGLDLQQISLSASTDQGDELKLDARVTSGDGTITLQGTSQLDPARGWPTRIRIQGENFQAARIPVATMTVSPDITVTIQDRNIDLQGELRVPGAKLQPRDITAAATVSADTVVIGGEAPAEKKWLITSKINLALGKRVTFFGYGFEGKLGGNLSIEEQPGQPTRGSGVITIREGRYRAYGQHLNIEDGRLLFAGGPLTNPGLDIRATRETGDVIAGVQVGGRLQKPELELFSSPAMGQTDTLSYLLTGGPLETASSEEGAMMANAALALGLSGGDRIARSIGDRFGFDDLRVESSSSGEQASLVVGRYLSPRLYVSYGVGLVESINTLNLRYQISSKWRLETESGAEQGADLLYSIER